MNLPPVAVRRAVVDPLWVPAAVLLAALLAVAAGICALAWPFTPRRRAARLALLAALYLVLDVAMVAACAALWLRHPVPRRRDPRRWTSRHVAVLRVVLHVLRAAAGPLLGLTVVIEEPAALASPGPGPVLVLARHAGPGDSFTLVELLLSRYHRCPRIVLKEFLQWDPGLDLVLNRLGAAFLPAVPGAGEDLPQRLAVLARGLRDQDAMLIFPEGRNWTPARYWHTIVALSRRAHRQAAQEALAHPNVLPPRPAGVLACLEARPDLDVVVVAHTGLEDLVSPAQVWQALPLTDRPMTVHWWYVGADDLPGDEAGRADWLRRQWATVDRWIAARKAAAGRPAAIAAPPPAPATPAGDPSPP